MALREIAAGVGFGVICLGSCYGCYWYLGENARQEIERTLDEERQRAEKTLRQMKKLVDGNTDNQNGAKIRDLERKKPILVYPEGFTGKKVSKKIAVPGMVDRAKAEVQKIEELFEQIDDSEDNYLDVDEMHDFVRDLAKALIRLPSGLEPRRRTQGESKANYCLSKSERHLLAPIVGVVMAGVDVGGTTDGQLDIEEFTLLMMFLKVILCKGHPQLTKLGIEGPMMTVDTWEQLLVNLKADKQHTDEQYGPRDASETELSDDDDDDDDSDVTGSDGETDYDSEVSEY